MSSVGAAAEATITTNTTTCTEVDPTSPAAKSEIIQLVTAILATNSAATSITISNTST